MNFTDKRGCWTTSERDLVLNYVKPNLYRYLFKEALPNLEYHLKSLTGLSEEELHLLKTVHFLLSPPVQDLLEEIPNILRNLSHSTQKEVIECRGIIRGKIDWNLTYKERFSQGFNDPSLFICKPASKMYDLPENQLLKFILWKIRSLTESINTNIPEELILKEEWDNWNEIISSRHFKAKNYSKNIYFQNISMNGGKISNNLNGNLKYLENPLSDLEIRNALILDLNKLFGDVQTPEGKFWDVVSTEIFQFQEILKKAGFDFGFRVINEIMIPEGSYVPKTFKALMALMKYDPMTQELSSVSPEDADAIFNEIKDIESVQNINPEVLKRASLMLYQMVKEVAQ